MITLSGANYGGWVYENGSVTFEENSVDAVLAGGVITVDGFQYRVDGDTATFVGME